MREKIEARGGRVVSHFMVKTSNKGTEEVEEEVKELVKKEDLHLYGMD
jgi:hypothetical protein